jgi:small subunit ribosomal protein S21
MRACFHAGVLLAARLLWRAGSNGFGLLRSFFREFGVGACGRQWPSDLSRFQRFMQIIVRENNVDQALRALKKKLQREGVYREMKLRRHYEKPSEKRAREKAAAVRRARKMERKRVERDGGK